MEHSLDLTYHWAGFSALVVFVIAYAFVMAEEFTHLRKSKPVVLAAGLIWGMIAIAYSNTPHYEMVEHEIRHSFLEYTELAFFLLVAMTYINALEERNVFNSLKSWLIKNQFSYRQLFWITGVLAFFLSPLADNLTTALVLCAVVVAVGSSSPKFVGLACVNIVVAANAGGAFSPFGDITTLMVWQAGQLDFLQFFALVIPSVVNYIIPASIMHFFVSDHKPEDEESKRLTFSQAATGASGIETLLPLSLELFHNNSIKLPKIIKLLTSNPAKVLKIDKGNLSIGNDADFCIVDINKPWIVKKEKMISKSKNTCIEDKKLQGKVTNPFVKGVELFKL